MTESKIPNDKKKPLIDLPWFTEKTAELWRDRGIVALVAMAILLPFIGSFGLWDPWETHYGEVARQITERNDWISTWWGSHWKDAGGSSEGAYFYSKPILLMWLMAMGMTVFGISELGIRLGVALVSVLAIVLAFHMAKSVFNRRTGFMVAAVLGTSPMWFFLSRQAQTDMPFVGLMTVALCFFMAAIFGRNRYDEADRFSFALTFGWIGLVTIPQFTLLIAGLSRWRGTENTVTALFKNDPRVSVGIGIAMLVLPAIGLLVSLLPKFVNHRRKIALATLALQWVPLIVFGIVALIVSDNRGLDLGGWFGWGPVQSGLYQTCLGAAIYWSFSRPNWTRQRVFLFGFYTFAALATLAKGLLGFMLPGAVIFFFILLTRRWRLLKEVDLLRGIPIFIAVAFPWYAGMLIRHTTGFWNRFFVHDHFKRLASGVHQIDTGSFEHFVKWLGYGMFPWSAFLPAAFSRFFSAEPVGSDEDESNAVFFLTLWAIIAFTLFTLSSTKFHHYIFPALPALSMLVGIFLSDMTERKRATPWILFLFALPIAGLLLWDIANDPQVLKNLFTYKYDREWNNAAWNETFRWALVGIAVPMFLGMIAMLADGTRIKRIGFSAIVVGGAALALFCLNVYMPKISDTWSQKGLWDYYYAQCDKTTPAPGSDPRKTYCEQPVVSYKLNWRGETYYSHNQVIPIRDDDDFTHFLSTFDADAFYGIMENGRFRGEFQRNLPSKFRGKACQVYNDNMKFVLAKVPCAPDDPERKTSKVPTPKAKAKPKTPHAKKKGQVGTSAGSP